ncbi:uncharacterized protein A4U43_C03F14520 [Asparagus officinalis]|uniref:Ribonucleotide reductase large subunit N-terminal domain-containing protein n=1 Tax=Asparagus officinalis TaxID=4686 RepID=A0A5P1FAL9_ASPOF|nr:uncharacterized protein A4U43_C03F14520 [Asparagus officinalis]
MCLSQNAICLDAEIIYNRDFYYDYFVFKVLERSCLLKVDGVVVERPQHMLMRASIGTHKSDIVSVIRTYQLMSERSYTLVNNVLFCAGTDWAQFSNCYIFCLEGDTVEGIYDAFKQCDHVIKSARGIDDTVQKIGSLSRTHGMSNGIIPMLRLYTDPAHYVDPEEVERKEMQLQFLWSLGTQIY